ncbi:type II toxin-antitoxin system Phd/YefM family antitoxin [Halomonas sp. 3H]|uniref:type II toxin-antitoxin system Phd/YefM family antitoxin n=1 Tax=Halomonas sp. 3H TaxID=2952527 RepID=UPI0020B7BBFA|nr:hypothetical protein [Halomonas sp. 3H]
MKIGIEEAEVQLEKLIERAHSGEHIIITGHSDGNVELIPAGESPRRAVTNTVLLGSMRGEIDYEEGWDAPLSEVEAKEFFGND